MKLKHRKTLFLLLIALAAMGSLSAYSLLEGSFLGKTVTVVILQQLLGAAIYFACFGVELVRSRSPFS
jgi:hypothetical protein